MVSCSLHEPRHDRQDPVIMSSDHFSVPEKPDDGSSISQLKKEAVNIPSEPSTPLTETRNQFSKEVMGEKNNQSEATGRKDGQAGKTSDSAMQGVEQAQQMRQYTSERKKKLVGKRKKKAKGIEKRKGQLEQRMKILTDQTTDYVHPGDVHIFDFMVETLSWAAEGLQAEESPPMQSSEVNSQTL